MLVITDASVEMNLREGNRASRRNLDFDLGIIDHSHVANVGEIVVVGRIEYKGTLVRGGRDVTSKVHGTHNDTIAALRH